MRRGKACDEARLIVVQGEQWGEEHGMCVVQGAFVVVVGGVPEVQGSPSIWRDG